MPMYEYKCIRCGHEFEELVFGSGLYDVRCPSCSSPEVERKLSGFSAAGSSKSSGGCNSFS